MRLRRLLPILSIAVAVHLPASGSVGQAGIISGRVHVPDEAPPPGRPAVSALAGSRHSAVDRRRAVVYLDSAPRRAFDELRPGRARMDQRGEQFVPRLLAVTVGTAVEFPNDDTTFHNVFSLSRVKTFDLGRYRPGRTGAVVFDRPGVVPVFCDIHTHMSAYILVFSHPFFTVTDTDGRFTIAGVPPGSYQLDVWSELGRATPLGIVVTDGRVTAADFTVRRRP
jgi:plastocyanin